MARPAHLPEPQLDAPVADCLRCGYALGGLKAPGPCPECGLAFEPTYLVLCGVAKSAGSGWSARRVLWIVIGVFTVAFSQVWGILFILHPLIAAAVGLALIVAVGGMILTRTRDRRGQERFVFGSRGIVCLPLAVGDEKAARAYIAWPPGAEIQVRRVSAFWREVRLGWPGGVIFNAGVRCPDEHAPGVEARLRSLAANAPTSNTA